jgi:sulfoxide reductase heme-binding subunit YedZ
MGKPALFVLALMPAAWLLGLATLQNLGANPVEHVIHFTGQWTLNFLLITLSVTPLRQLSSNQFNFLRFRRMLGLFAFFYATLHVLSYVGLDQWFSMSSIAHDIEKHRFVLVGFVGYLTLIPLAATSNRWAVARLGKRWKSLHRLAYLAPALGVLHFTWLVKKDLSQPLAYGAMLALLLALRLPLRAK